MESMYLEAWTAAGPKLLPLTGERMVVGKDPSSDVLLDGDPTVSRTHAVLERVGAAWSVSDLASRNGTFLNGERLLGRAVLREGDELRLGKTRVTVRGSAAGGAATETAQPPPEVTLREKAVLLALCRPVLGGSLLTQPATVRQIADDLVITESAVKKHLLRLYDKFGIADDVDGRRGRLANEAIQRGAVTMAELRAPERASRASLH